MLSTLTYQSCRNWRMRLPRNHQLTSRLRNCKDDWTRNSSSIFCSKRYQSSDSSTNALRTPVEDSRSIPSALGRFAVAIGIFHMISEYGMELTMCEGPSMYPTIRQAGEVILIDKFSPRWRGVQGGCVGKDRAKAARIRQEAWQKAGKRSNDNGHVTSTAFYQWYEPRVPVNELPSGGEWRRLWNQVSTGISVGDVVVVEHPNREGSVCKRVLGLPGDIVVAPPTRLRKSRNREPNYQPGLLIIPDGHIWIEGDNTMNSADSRYYGPVPAALIIGRVVCRIWPLRGSAMLHRSAPPKPPEGAPHSGSTILPAGYEGEEIVKVCEHVSNKAKTKHKDIVRTR